MPNKANNSTRCHWKYWKQYPRDYSTIPQDFQLVGISADKNGQALAEIAKTFQVSSITLSNEMLTKKLFKQSNFSNKVKFMVAIKHCTNSLKQLKPICSLLPLSVHKHCHPPSRPSKKASISHSLIKNYSSLEGPLSPKP